MTNEQTAPDQPKSVECYAGMSIELRLTPKLELPPEHATRAALIAIATAAIPYPVYSTQTWPHVLVLSCAPPVGVKLEDVDQSRRWAETIVSKFIADHAGLCWPLKYHDKDWPGGDHEKLQREIDANSLMPWHLFEKAQPEAA